MYPIPVLAVFDVGKTNKKLLLFDEQFNVVDESVQRFSEITDESGFPCEDLNVLKNWILNSLKSVLLDNRYDVKAVNFSAYGASLVYLDQNGESLTPLYNYLKPFPDGMQEKLCDQYGGAFRWARETASPILGSLNSGMQLYRLKLEMPELYARTHMALHLPQYLSFLLTGKTFSEITSIGCHTGLWDFEHQRYHRWVQDYGLDEKLAPIVKSDHIELVNLFGKSFRVGVGLHDSSAALVPYLRSFQTPFALLSTGTWCITLNPFNHHPLTDEELSLDCLAYMSYQHQQVKASRLFAGQLHELYLGKIADHFGVDPKIIQSIEYDPAWAADWRRKQPWETLHSLQPPIIENLYFAKRDISDFKTVKEAYHALVMDLVALQTISSRLVLNGTPVQHLYVDGGFSKNQIFLSELSASFSNIHVCRMEIAQASALGAAMAISS